MTVDASSEQAGYPASNALDGQTATQWRHGSPDVDGRASLQATFAGAPVAISYVAMAAHNIGTVAAREGVDVRVYISLLDDLDEEIIGFITTPIRTDDAIIILFPETEGVHGIEVGLEYSVEIFEIALADVPSVGVIAAGQTSFFPAADFTGAPLNLDRDTEVATNYSFGGQFLGRSVRRKSLDVSLTIRHLDHNLVYSEGRAFQEAAERGAFWVADKPLTSPESCVFMWSEDGVSFDRAAPRLAKGYRMRLKGTGFQP